MVEERDGAVAVVFYLLVEGQDVLLNLCDGPTIAHFLVGSADDDEVELFLAVDLVVHLDAEG